MVPILILGAHLFVRSKILIYYHLRQHVVYYAIMNFNVSFTGTQDIHTVNKISVQKQHTITIPCLYDHKYVNYPKCMSYGAVWIVSRYVSHNRMTIVDNQTEHVFTATLRDAEVSDSGWYWCAVCMSGSDPRTHLYLQVTEGILSSFINQSSCFCDDFK